MLRGLTVVTCLGLALGSMACHLPQQGAGAPTQPEPAGTGPVPSEPGATPDAAAGGAQAPSGPQYASFTLRNSCRETVKLFFGDKPKFGSGKSTSISGNSQQNESMREGDMIWIVDASDNGVSSYTVSAGVHEVNINSGCNGFEAH